MIDYTYSIIHQSVENQVVEVIFSAPGYDDVHIGMRFPWDNLTLEQVVQMYAPISHWMNLGNKTSNTP